MLSLFAIVISYLIGSVSFSMLVARNMYSMDIRQHGSGNAGATNTLRVLGKGPGLAVLLLDACKGIAAILIGWLLSDETWVHVACGVAVIVGHNWPVFFRFKGGKGIATTIGVLALLAFYPALIAGIFGIAVIAWTRYVSLGSLVFTTGTSLFILLFRYDSAILVGSLLICALAIYRHRGNIQKLIKGTENRLGSKEGGAGRVR
ncbi:glycerol-3-phosphate 1-O-acyltransferase PlsY [Paenibacillus sp. 481]|uniref:glycerol-3-phosphate 1-O-acyltransferase PlsY n=1 Tax=Paenibacillus sp. 481 TaxID=2835869 RepID=UPI001E4611B2|nr:glycerol-3-phosphate 1-O-acyltransferase PlsY [Paenibacillus sp. 481]UHA72948.1 glycerol-3-phosphate 1-O-acyltransferase PlsY [Paenibacillus sp. 481]